MNHLIIRHGLSRPSLTFFGSGGDVSAELLEEWVRPLCTLHGVDLAVAPEDADRSDGLVAHFCSTLVLWDCSLDGFDSAYRALVMQAKLSAHHLLVSRTPIPRNILARGQCAPIHGHTVSNAVLGEWLDRELFRRLGRGEDVAGDRTGMARPYWLFDTPADHFLSFRGTVQAEAERWRMEFERTHPTSVRMVPPNEYSYPTEVVTRQQAWEGVARLMREMRATTRVIVYPSPDYFDSFWTSSELLTMLWLLGQDRRSGQADLREAHFAVPGERPGPFPIL